MFEAALPISIYLVSSIAGSIYVQKFLRAKNQRIIRFFHEKKIAPFVWSSLYFMIQSLALERFDSANPLHDLVRVLADIGAVLLLQMLLYQKDISKQFFVAVSFVAGREIIRYIVVGLYSRLYSIWGELTSSFVQQGWIILKEEIERWIFVSDIMIWIIIILLYALMLITYLSVIANKFIRKDYQFKPHEYTFLILPSITTICISITLKMIIITVENGTSTIIFDKVPATMFWVPLICFLLLGVNITSVIIFQKLVQLSKEEKKRVILENQMVQMQREIEEIQDIYADMRGLRHDMRSHLESIAAVIRRTSGMDREELDGYIGSMEKAVSRLDFVYRTGNPITDVIIHQKKQEAEKEHISFEADFIYPDKQQIDAYDIGIVLNNGLENAIEASGRLVGKKSICLRSYMKGNLFFIEIENDFIGEISFNSETGLPLSTKDDKLLHGVGMENIQRCAKKYKGDIDITIRDVGDRKQFSLTVMFYEKYFTSNIP